MDALFETNLSLPGRRRGKVRDVYEVPASGAEPPRLLIVATDRISAFDVVMPTPIPGKGAILTDIAARWFRWIEARGLARTHLLSTEVGEVPGITGQEREALRGRITLGRRCRVVPIECVARGYLAGSGWVDYQATGAVCGVRLPAGLRSGDRLVDGSGAFAPIFTPATKEEQGRHDENISYEQAAAAVGEPVMRRLRDATLAIYSAAHEHALSRGVILADTKFEWGLPLDANGQPTGEDPILVDEALTPDSSRYWPAEDWRPGREQPSFDKQFLREHLLGLVASGRWDKSPPGPELPEPIVRGTLAKYEEARRRLFG
ncbi:MAG: phosphoribosylaminoimidazolesuccinocarboxamide synthase [Phycisphaerales bacterium]|nr:phosphoribosylaminoimidazolesuccinocarboxamide synthase [Phycisphaerales bacterium]